MKSSLFIFQIKKQSKTNSCGSVCNKPPTHMSAIREFARRLYSGGACVCILCAAPILSSGQTEDADDRTLRMPVGDVPTPSHSTMPSRNNSGCSNTSSVTGVEDQRGPLTRIRTPVSDVPTPSSSVMPSRNSSGCSSTSFVTGMEAQQCPLSKHQWQRLSTAPRACPKILHKHLLKTLNRHSGEGKIILTIEQMKQLGLQHLCWDGYIEVGEYFYRPALPPALKQGMVDEIRCIGIDPCTEKMTVNANPGLEGQKH